MPPAILRMALPLAAALPLGACLMVAPIEEEEVPANYPPTFVPERATPPFEQVVLYDPALTSEPIDFSVLGVTDADETDRLYWRWFTNYDARFFPYVNANGPPNGREPGPTGAKISLPFVPCVDLASFLLSGRTLHWVEVLVSDRPFLVDDESTVNRNQTLAPEAGQFRVVWFVEVDLTRCPVAP